MCAHSLPSRFARLVDVGLMIALTLATAVSASASPPSQLVITEAVANEEEGLLTIVGRNFGDSLPTVTLGGAELVVVDFQPAEIIAELPAGLLPGTYSLVVSRGPGAVAVDDFALVLGLGDGDAEDEITAVIAGEGLTGGGDTGDVELGLDFAALDDAYARLDAPNSFQFEQTAPTFNGDTVQAGVVFAGEMTASNADGTASYGETSADGASGVAGFSNAPAFAIGVSGSIDSASGYALYGSSFVPTGDIRAVFAEVFSPEGTAGYFVNGANGTILSGHAENEALVFRVTGDGTVQGNAFTDLAGNPIGADGVGVFQVDTGAGLAGGPITGSGVIEVDFGNLDSRYPRIDQENFYDVTQYFADVAVGGWLDAASIHAQNDDPTSYVIDGLSLAGSGQTRAINGTTLSPDSIAVAGHVAAPGPGGGAGVLGSTESDDGFGVGGFATSTAGYAVGVYGETYGENTIGVRGSVLTGGGVGGVGVSGASDGDGGIGVLGTSDHPTGTAGVLRGQGGQLLRAETFGGEVFSVAGNGDVNAAGTVFANAVVETSARRFKTNVRPLVDPLTTVGRLRGVAFDWKDDGRADIGLIAEEVAEVLPEIVGVEADGTARGVNYGRLTALLLEAVKAQQATIESLQSQVLMLEASLDR